MATYTKRGDKVYAQVRMKGRRGSGTFDSMGAARAWAIPFEAGIIADTRGEVPDLPFAAVLERYRDQVSVTKKGHRWEAVRINQVLRDPIAAVRLKDLDSKDVSEWRDRRLLAVKQSSCRREWNLLSSACNVAIGEWHWLRINPFSKAAGAKRPRNSAHRDEVIQPADLEVLTDSAAANQGPNAVKVVRVVRFAIETAMRASEILFLGANPARVCTRTRVARLPDTKNGNARDVPLSAEAVRLWDEAQEEGNRWGLTSTQLDTHWRKLRASAGLDHLHFHDTRHTAITALAKKLQILDLARMAGITDLKILMVYYNESAASIALKL